MVAPVRYKIAQKVRSWRLKRKYTIKDLAEKTGINYHTLRRYELGVCGIPVGELQVIADALSVSLSDLLPRQKVLKENRCCDKTQWIYNFIAKTRGRKAIYALTKSIRAEEESAIKAARIRMARNMLKAGFANDIIYRATGLSTYEYDNAEEEICTDSIYYKIGQRIKEWRLIRRNTQKDLADKVGLTPKEIHEYERGYTAVSFDKLYEIAGVLSVNIRALLPKTRKNEDGKEENRLLGFLRACLQT